MQWKDGPRPHVNAQKQPPEGDGTSVFLAEEADDNRILKVSLWGAIGLHAILLLINFPTSIDDAVADEPAERAHVIIRETTFCSRPITTTIPNKEARMIPVPAFTPETIEITRLDDAVSDLDLPSLDGDFLVIPDAPSAPAQPEGPTLVSGEVRKPERLHTPQPNYTEIARRAHIQGLVIVQAIIDRHGDVVQVKVLKGLPMGLSEETIKTIKQWKFKPATLHGKPVDVYFNLTVHFKFQ